MTDFNPYLLIYLTNQLPTIFAKALIKSSVSDICSQDKVTSLQIVVATTSSKMVAFTEMFQTVDDQLRDMWSVSIVRTW